MDHTCLTGQPKSDFVVMMLRTERSQHEVLEVKNVVEQSTTPQRQKVTINITITR